MQFTLEANCTFNDSSYERDPLLTSEQYASLILMGHFNALAGGDQDLKLQYTGEIKIKVKDNMVK